MTIKFVFTPGYTGDTGCRIFYVQQRNKAELEKHLQSQTSETRSSEIIRQEYERVKNFTEVNFGSINKVNQL